MALFTENISPVAQEAYLPARDQWMPSTPDMEADVHAICLKWGISPPDFNDEPPLSSSLSEEDLIALSAFVSGYDGSWRDVGDNDECIAMGSSGQRGTPAEETAGWVSPLAPGTNLLPSQSLLSVYPLYTDHSSEEQGGEWEPPSKSIDLRGDLDESLSTNPSSVRSSSPSMTPVTRDRPPSEHEPLSGRPVAPSRRLSLDGHARITNRPYPALSARSFHRRHFTTMGLQHIPVSPSEGKDQAAAIVESSAPLDSVSSGVNGAEHHIVNSSLCTSLQNPTLLTDTSRVRKGRMAVPLGEWKPKRAPKAWEPQAAIEFWSRETVTGARLSGTFLSDRFQEDTGRSFLFENDLPFPDKKEKGFNLRVLWPGYAEFSKKISVHKPLSDCTLRDVRDWVFNALSDFIRTPGVWQGQESEFWRVGVDGNAVHLDDLVLVRLRQVGKGTWVPDLDFLDWERVV